MAFIPVYILILFFTIGIDYFAGIMIEKSAGKKRKLYLVFSIIANIGILSFFKYYNFFSSNVNSLLHDLGFITHSLPLLSIILPIGLSFHTFQAMSYTIEVYRSNQKAERHLGIYSLYVMFYPQLVAGPIERPQNLLHQFREKYDFDSTLAGTGLKLMLWGLFKKIVIADQLATLTTPVFNNPHSYPAITLLLAAVAFSFQIFCDFSGYSDIAIGAAKVMGITLMKNFDYPYISKSVSEFWKRWHISLSTWFKDYLYISLGGNRVSVPRWYFNLLFVFLVSGLWHGANWTFVAWGALHGLYLILSLVTSDIRKRIGTFTGIYNIQWLHSFLQIASTYILVTIAWVFFRANSLNDAFYIISRLPYSIKDLVITIHTRSASFWNLWDIAHFNTIYYVLLILLLISVMALMHSLRLRTRILDTLKTLPLAGRLFVYYAVIMIIIYSVGDKPPTEFIYFQF